MSKTSISIKVDGVQHGWANAAIFAGDLNYGMRGFSYTTDAFADLARFGVDVALNAHGANVRFDGEPCGWLWEFERTWPAGAAAANDHFWVHELEVYYDLNSRSIEVLSSQVDRDQLAGAILTALKEVREKLGEDGFERDWGQSFPSRGVAAPEAAREATERK